MATENGLYNTINAIHNRHYTKQITRKFETANLCPAVYIIMQKAGILNAI
jgi:hypothetical protein